MLPAGRFKDNMTGIYLLHGFLFLEIEAQGIISEELDPLSAKRIDRLQEAFAHSKLNSAVIP